MVKFRAGVADSVSVSRFGDRGEEGFWEGEVASESGGGEGR